MATYEPYRLTQTGAQVQQDLNDVEALAPATTEAAGLMSAADKAKLDNLPSGTELENSLSGKVDKVEGKGLSKNDYTDEEKAKLGNIAPGAEVNTISTVKVNGTALTPVDKAVDVTVPDVSGKADKVSSPTAGNFAGLDSNGNLTDSGKKASDFATAAQGAKADTALQSQKQADWNEADSSDPAFIKNKPNIPAGVVVDQTYDGTSANAQSGVAMSGALAGKQDTINDLSDIRTGAGLGATAVQPEAGKGLFSGNYNDLSNKPDLSGFITKSVDDLVNYYLKSETYTKAEVQNLIAAINQFHYEIYASTSAVTDPASNVLYLIGPTGTGADKYEEYVYDSTKQDPWVKIGDTSIDLSGYVTTSALNTALADYTTTANLTTLLAGKQDKIDSTHKLDYSLVDNTPTIPDAVEANPTVPSGTTPTDLTGLKVGSDYFSIPEGGGDDEATEVTAAALCDLEDRMLEKKNLVDTYDQTMAGNHEMVATSYALYKYYRDQLTNEEILATALCDLKIMGALASAIAPLYEQGTRTFAVDDCCIYGSQFYRCITAVTTPEPFNSAKWVKTSLFEEMVRRFNAI